MDLFWLGLDENRRLCYRAFRDGGLTPRDEEMLAVPRVAIMDARGERIHINSWGRTGEGTFYICLRPDQKPAKALICPTPKTYAGIIEFSDVPIPPLPALP